MKKLYILSWILFLSGVIFQFLQWPGTAILLLTAGLLFLIHSALYWFKNFTTYMVMSFLYFTISLISLYIVGRLHFWAWAKFVFFPACIFFIAAMIFSVVKKSKIKVTHVFLFCYFSFFIWFSYVPSYKLYYAIRLNTFLNAESRNLDYQSWDKYSWFLNLRNKKDEALEANRLALMAANKCIETSGDKRAKEFLALISQHNFQIVHNEWTDYP